MDQHTERTFERFPVIIGRSKACDYVLNDPGRYVSSNHAIISCVEEQLLLEDTSANGTFVNGSDEALGRGHPVPIKDGDLLTIGDFALHVSLAENRVSDSVGNTGSSPVKSADYDPFHDAKHDWSAGPGNNPFDSQQVTPANSISARSGSTSTEDDANWADWAEPTPSPPQPKPLDSPPVRMEISDTEPRVATPAGEQDNHSPAGRHSADTLLRAAGLDPSEFAGVDPDAIMALAGSLLQESTGGVMRLLATRGKLKTAIKSEVTRLSRTENNPLKFSADATDALTRLLGGASDGIGSEAYLEAGPAMQQAVEDLGAHQLAMIEGMKAAVSSVLALFDPTALENTLQAKRSLSTSLPLTREARLWTLFCEHYSTLNTTAMNDFSALFGKEFRRAYERRLKRQHLDR